MTIRLDVRDPEECIDLGCGHFDGDQCLVGGMDCPEEPKCKCQPVPAYCIPIINADCPLHGSRFND